MSVLPSSTTGLGEEMADCYCYSTSLIDFVLIQLQFSLTELSCYKAVTHFLSRLGNEKKWPKKFSSFNLLGAREGRGRDCSR